MKYLTKNSPSNSEVEVRLTFVLRTEFIDTKMGVSLEKNLFRLNSSGYTPKHRH